MNTPERLTSQPMLLALDTSARCTNIALARGDQVITSMSVPGDERRSERLWLDLGELLRNAGLRIEAVELFAVCVGPGGFTGLRVGVAAAKGLAAAAGKPIAGVTSLEAAASEAKGVGTACAMVGAYKGEVYWQLFSVEDTGLPVALSEPLVSTSNEAVAQVAGLPELVFTGDAVESSVELIRHTAGPRFIEGPSASGVGWRVERGPLNAAEAVARVALLKWWRGALENAEGLRALYVRPAEAEVKRSLGLLGSKIERSR
ncbi:MAG TPA: tRNA (adenosine(37)-N6)-threonylcarbamoyltransferase complex dimerization subunit type 1 TsaB, partial [Blastocatellia bacterium]|nr:tRNA (adenosine(37)-N6)-threonylcarbamoyltransferase complex dimerization subunit type 1 TsaB [Blastocatellia bacterium]